MGENRCRRRPISLRQTIMLHFCCHSYSCIRGERRWTFDIILRRKYPPIKRAKYPPLPPPPSFCFFLPLCQGPKINSAPARTSISRKCDLVIQLIYQLPFSGALEEEEEGREAVAENWFNAFLSILLRPKSSPSKLPGSVSRESLFCSSQPGRP